MNSFLVRRLDVFLICFIGIELLAALYLAIDNFDNVDWTFKTIVQDIGVLQLTSFVSFLVMIFPYVVYLTFLPKKYQNNKYDKFITYAVFTIFTFLNILENVSSIIFWSEFNILKNTTPEKYFEQARQILLEIYAEHPLAQLLSIILVCSLLLCLILRKFLFTKIEAPSFGRQIFHFILYIAVCFLAFMNIDIEKLNNRTNSYNSRIAEDKTYSLFNSFIKKNSRLMLLRNRIKNSHIQEHNIHDN